MDIGDVAGRGHVWDAATAVTVAVDLWEVSSAARVLRVGGLSLAQTTELGDAQHEILTFQYVYGNTSGGSGGGTPVAFYTGTSGSDGGATIECRNTTQASGGAPSKGPAQGWNVLQPVDIWYPNGLEPQLNPDDGSGELNAIRLLAAPADSVTMLSTLWLRGIPS